MVFFKTFCYKSFWTSFPLFCTTGFHWGVPPDIVRRDDQPGPSVAILGSRQLSLLPIIGKLPLLSALCQRDTPCTLQLVYGPCWHSCQEALEVRTRFFSQNLDFSSNLFNLTLKSFNRKAFFCFKLLVHCNSSLPLFLFYFYTWYLFFSPLFL